MEEKELLKRITLNPNVCFGKPTIRNKRYTVQLMLELLVSGMSYEEILADYRDLQRDDILASILFAKKMLEVKSIEKVIAA